MSFPNNSGVDAPGANVTNSSGSVPFVIQELTGQCRVVSLYDRALPFQGIEFPGKMKVETHYYPGNPIATQQIIGSEEGSTTITGVWNDRFVSANNSVTPQILVSYLPLEAAGAGFSGNEGTQVQSLFDIVALFDDIRRQGQQLRVSWGQVIRVGVMTMFKPKWLRPVDVEWTMEFDWASQGEDFPNYSQPPPSVSEASAEMQEFFNNVASYTAMFGVINPPPVTPPNPFTTPSQSVASIYNQIATGIAAPAKFVAAINGYLQNGYYAVQQMSNIANQVATLSSTSQQIALQIAALGTYAIEQLEGVEDTLDTLPSVYYYNVDLPPPAPPGPVALPIASITAGQMLCAESAARQTRKAARDSRLKAATLRAQFAAMAQPSSMLSVFVAAQNQDLRRVATQFYGSPDSWREIATYNDLPGSQLQAGQLIFVPQQPPQSTAQGIPSSPPVGVVPSTSTVGT